MHSGQGEAKERAETQVWATKFGKRVYSDISTIKHQNEELPAVTKPNWHMLVDEATRLKISAFYESKNGMVKPTCEKFHCWKQAGHLVVCVRQDNARKNKLLQGQCNSAAWKLGIVFEYMARDTLQQNHLAELAFAMVIKKT